VPALHPPPRVLTLTDAAVLWGPVQVEQLTEAVERLQKELDTARETLRERETQAQHMVEVRVEHRGGEAKEGAGPGSCNRDLNSWWSAPHVAWEARYPGAVSLWSDGARKQAQERRGGPPPCISPWRGGVVQVLAKIDTEQRETEEARVQAAADVVRYQHTEQALQVRAAPACWRGWRGQGTLCGSRPEKPSRNSARSSPPFLPSRV
jgi:hypothetical protein